MRISRRDALKLSLSGAAASLAAGRLPLAIAAAGKIPIGLQLYSVRNELKKDLPGVIAGVAKLGYQGVEFAGYYDRKADELRKILDQNGLKCCGTHTSLASITGDALQATVEFNQTLGNKFLIVPGLPRKNVESKQALIDTAKFFTETGEKVKSQGMKVGYHAHGPDFQKIDGETHWDILFSHVGPDVVMQLDIGNCMGGGGDPISILKKFPGRSLTIHIKEHGGRKGAPVGEGEVDWKQVFQLCETTGKTEWYIVEQEAYAAGQPLDSIADCIKNLRKMGK